MKLTGAILALLSISQVANSATITNGNFDSGLAGWSAEGNVSVVGGYAILNTFSPVDTSAYGGTSGSILSQTVNGLAGDVISFSYNFFTIDYMPYNDFAIVVGDDRYLISDVSALGGSFFTGWQNFTFTALHDFAGLKFVVSNHTDTFNDSIIALDDITISSGPGSVSAVPVPAAVWLFGSGLVGLLGYRKRGQSLTA